MVQGRAKLGARMTWYVRQSVSLEAKELEKQAIDGHEMIFHKWIKIKSRGPGLLSYQTRIINKLGFYSEEDT